MTIDELSRDPDVLVRVKVEKNSGSTYFCSFDVAQDTKYRAGTKVIILENEDPFESFEIVEWDILSGKLALSGKTGRVPDGEFTLALAQTYFNKDAVLKSVLRQAQAFDKKKKYFGLKKALHDLILKKSPDITGRPPSRPLLKEGERATKAIADVVLSMNETVLCIQGPPGTGKTYTASHVIAELIKAGRTAVVSSNSHKAINHLLVGVAKVCTESPSTLDRDE